MQILGEGHYKKRTPEALHVCGWRVHETGRGKGGIRCERARRSPMTGAGHSEASHRGDHRRLHGLTERGGQRGHRASCGTNGGAIRQDSPVTGLPFRSGIFVIDFLNVAVGSTRVRFGLDRTRRDLAAATGLPPRCNPSPLAPKSGPPRPEGHPAGRRTASKFAKDLDYVALVRSGKA
jgi:hypothetical protein